MDPLRLEQSNRQLTDDMLADPAWRKFHTFVKWSLIVCGIGMLIECTLMYPYILIRFGYGGN